MSVLVAGIGNIFFGDDGFGPEVVRELERTPLEGAKVEDFGIRTLHLAYELVAGYDRAIIIDAVVRGEAPGTLFVIEPELREASATADAHGMDLRSVFGFVRTIGGTLPPVTLVGCEPAAGDEGIGLTEPVQRAVPAAADLVRNLVAECLETADRATRSGECIVG